jgi:hypothetical protein
VGNGSMIKKMDKEFKYGQMVQNMKVNGLKIFLKAMENLQRKMVIP